MSVAVNKYEFSGRVGRTPEMKYAANGNAYLNFSIAINTGYYDKKNEAWVDGVQWVNCTIWGKSAEYANGKLDKGQVVFVSGVPSARGYEQDGEIKASLNVNVKDFVILQKENAKKTEKVEEPVEAVEEEFPF